MKKDFIMDGETIRNCPSNIAKMNLWEVLRYGHVCWNISWKTYFEAIATVILFPLILIFYPAIMTVEAYNKRKRDREFCKKHNVNY